MRYMTILDDNDAPVSLFRSDGVLAWAFTSEGWQRSPAAHDRFSGVEPDGVEIDAARARTIAQQLAPGADFAAA